MDVDAYLRRIGYAGSPTPTAAILRELHRAHLRAVPFENLDIHLGIPIVLDLDRLFEKIVIKRRGGFCYELNGLFGALLMALGYRVNLLSARVAGDGVALGPEFDHMLLQVECLADGDGVRWLADVGFGDSYLSPLRLDERGDQIDGLRAYRVESTDDLYWLWERDYAGQWARQYCFTLSLRQLADFAPMCEWQQTSPESPFTQRQVVTLATLDGRITLRNDRLIITTHGVKRDEPIESEAAYWRLLRDKFHIDLSEVNDGMPANHRR
jgi:N-hydroxyarylamine O-acetyltransferase